MWGEQHPKAPGHWRCWEHPGGLEEGEWEGVRRAEGRVGMNVVQERAAPAQGTAPSSGMLLGFLVGEREEGSTAREICATTVGLPLSETPPDQPLPGEGLMEPGAGKGDELLGASQP